MPKEQKHQLRKPSRGKDPKESHLYTDDNPSTTLHGTGFKDLATANKTIKLVSRRSLTYQFQTINTMLYRALGHPHKTSGIQEAIKVLRDWVEHIYPAKKAALRQFKLLDKRTVERYLKLAEEWNEDHEHGTAEHGTAEHDEQSKGTAEGLVDISFATVYCGLAPRKRLANTLVDATKPGEEDWEIRRYNALCTLLPTDEYEAEVDLWAKGEQKPTPSIAHLRLIMWAYSPEKKLR